MEIKLWNSEEEIGYKQITTFFMDFSVADKFGISAIKDTYKRAFEYWKNDYKYLTELSMVLNRKCWYFAEENEDYSNLYADLYYKTRDYALENLKDEDLQYYLKITD